LNDIYAQTNRLIYFYMLKYINNTDLSNERFDNVLLSKQYIAVLFIAINTNTRLISSLISLHT